MYVYLCSNREKYKKNIFSEEKYEIVVKMNKEIFVFIFLITFDIWRIIIIRIISR